MNVKVWCGIPVWVIFECLQMLAGDQKPSRDVAAQPPPLLSQDGWDIEAQVVCR